ncbi:hypothetical protein D3C71_984180 [compost metagenome]
MRQGVVAQAASGGDFLATRKIARPRKCARLDHVAGDDIQTRFCGSSSQCAGPAHFQIALGDAHAPQDVLLGRHELDCRQAGLVVPGKMRMRFCHARHQERAVAVDNARIAGIQVFALTGQRNDAVRVYQHFTRVRIRA